MFATIASFRFKGCFIVPISFSILFKKSIANYIYNLQPENTRSIVFMPLCSKMLGLRLILRKYNIIVAILKFLKKPLNVSDMRAVLNSLWKPHILLL